MRRLIGLATAHPVSAVTLWSVVVVFGVVALTRLPVDLMPTIPLPRITVVTEYENLPAKEMEQLVTIPVEDALASVSGTRRIASTTKEGISSVELAFDWGADLSVASVEVREQIDRVFPGLPAGSDKPIVVTRHIGRDALLQIVAVPRNDRSISFISDSVSFYVAAELRQLPGVGRVQLQGGRRPEVHLDVDLGRLRAAGLALGDVTRTVGESVFELPAGSYEDGPIERVVTVTTGVESLEALRRIPLPVPAGALRLGDVASVRMGEARATSIFLFNGEDALGLTVYPSPGAGALAVSEGVRRTLKELSEVVGREMELRIVADGAQEIRRALGGLALAAGIGALAAAVVLRWAFRTLLPAALAITALPISAAGSFLVLYLAGLSLNVISLSGIAIGIGMVVDNNVVVLENIRRRRAATPEQVAKAAIEMGSSTFAGTVTTLLVFLPIVFVPGVVGLLFRDLALSVSLLLAFSLPVSLTLTPALVLLAGWTGGHLLGVATPAPVSAAAEARRLRGLGWLLGVVLRRPYLAVATYGLFVIGGLALFLVVPRELAPERASDRFDYELTLLPGTSYQRVREIAGEIDAGFAAPSVRGRLLYAGFEEEVPLERGQADSGFRHLRGSVLLDSARLSLPSPESAAGVGFAAVAGLVLAPPVDGLSAALGSGEGPMVEIRSRYRREAESLADSLADQLEGAQVETSQNRMAYRLLLEPEAQAVSGIAAPAVLATLSNAVRGTVAAQLPTPMRDVDIRVRLRSEDTGSVRGLGRIAVVGATSEVELAALGRFEEVRIAETLLRVDRQPVARVRVPGLDSSLEEIVPPEGSIRGAGALREAAREIGMVFGLAVLLIYLLLGAQFESFWAPLGILAMIPLGLGGSLLLLGAMQMSVNVSSVLGILVLFGTSVNTTILLTDAYRRRPGDILRVTVDRGPAVLITAATTVVALTPLVVLPIPGGELQAQTAAALLGGLVTGTFGTLVIYPGLYSLGRRGVPEEQR